MNFSDLEFCHELTSLEIPADHELRETLNNLCIEARFNSNGGRGKAKEKAKNKRQTESAMKKHGRGGEREEIERMGTETDVGLERPLQSEVEFVTLSHYTQNLDQPSTSTCPSIDGEQRPASTCSSIDGEQRPASTCPSIDGEQRPAPKVFVLLFEAKRFAIRGNFKSNEDLFSEVEKITKKKVENMLTWDPDLEQLVTIGDVTALASKAQIQID